MPSAQYPVVLLSVLFSSLYIQYAKSQALISVETSFPYECQKEIELQCKYTGTTSCCQILRGWTRNGVLIMNNGAELVTSGKYSEQVNDDENFFILKIKNVSESDYGVPFVCTYASDSSSPISLDINDMSGFCSICFGKSFGFGFIGVLIIVIVAVVICVLQAFEKKKIFLIVGVTAGVSVVLDIVVVGLIGAYTCLCADGKTICPICILIGLGVSLPAFLIVYFIFKGSSASNSSSGTDTGTGLSCFPGSKICPGPTPEEPSSRPSNKDSKPVKKEKKENSPAHVKTDNTTPRSKLDDVPLHRPLPQIGGTTSPSTTGHPDPDKRNITKLPPMEMTSESEEKKKKKKKKKKQSDGLANDGYDD